MPTDIEVQDPSPAMLDDKQTAQLLERDCRDGEQIECDDRLAMFPKEREPTLARTSRVKHAPEIARDTSFGDLEAELQQFAMYLRGSPTSVLVCETAYQIPNLAQDSQPASLGTRSPSPIQSEAGTVPSN